MMRNSIVLQLFLSLVVVYLPSDGHPHPYCPEGFELHGQKCYIALGLYASWPEAKEYCRIIGGDLASISSNFEQNLISGMMVNLIGKIPHSVYWLDGSNMLKLHEWRWMGDRGESTPISYTNWAPGQPDSPLERCLEIRYDWGTKWNNHWCNVLNSFICETAALSFGMELRNDTLQDP